MSARPVSSVYFSPRRGATDVLVGFIDRAEKTLDCAVYSFTNPNIADALIRAHQRGVAVRVLVDKVQASSKSGLDERLEAAGVPVCRDTSSGLMHHKFAVCDAKRRGRQAVVTGSFNWTLNAEQRNAENLVVLRSKVPVAAFAAEFETLWCLHTAGR